MRRRWWSGFPIGSLWALIYLGFLAFQPAYVPTWWGWPLAVVIAVGFAAFYIAVEWRPGLLRRTGHVVAAILGLVLAPFNGGASTLLVYSAAFAGSYLSRRAAVQWFAGLTGVCLVVIALSAPVNTYLASSFVWPLLLVWVVGLACVRTVERERAAAELTLQNARIEQLATLSERERIARDLHDVVGHALTGIVVRAQLAARLVRADPDAAAGELDAIERIARESLTDVRETVSGWRQVDVDDELDAARDALAAAGVTLTVDRDPDLVLTPSAATALGLAVREAVTNVVRHAGASACTVNLRHEAGQVLLEITDDGIGASGPDGNGLSGMRERIVALGGETRRRSGAARRGTQITVALPRAVAT
jgi:two-component system, NarL family, sensor histidine kinase DesK